MNWIRKILGLEHPERITMELIERLPAHKLCRKYIDRELDADIETVEFDNIMCAVELDAEVNVRNVQRIPLSNSEQYRLQML